MANAARIHDVPPAASPIDPGSPIVFRYEKNGYRIYEAAESGLMFVHPQPSAQELARLYGEEFFARGNKYSAGSAASDPQLKNDLQKLSLIRKYCRSGKLLDVGSAKGGFLRAARELGFEVEGLEVSEYGADFTEKQLGIKVHRSELPHAKLPAASFDVVTMWDVIEHLRDLNETLAEVARILKPGGLLFVATGDIASPYARLMGKRWHLLTPPFHLFYFTPKSLKKTLAQHGLVTERIHRSGKSASIDFVLFKAQETIGSLAAAARSVLSRLGLKNKTIYVNVGDIMTAVARKS